MLRPRSRKAESLIETIIAVMVITLAVSAAMGLLRTSVLGNNIIGTKAVALNLAVEGIDAVKNVRDTNYLRFASDPDNCWNKLNVTDVADCTAFGVDEITEGVEYYLYRDFEDERFEWEMTPTDATDTGNIDLYGVDTDGNGSFETQMYAQENLSELYISPPIESALFNRVIDISYDGDNMIVSVTMTWDARGISKSLTLTRNVPHVL